MDGVDAALVEIGTNRLTTFASATTHYPPALRARLLDAIAPAARLTLHDWATLHIEVGEQFAAAAIALLDTAQIPADAVTAVGSHGQTLRHHPQPPHPYSVQIGDAATIAARTGRPTVADFRSIDLAYGGQGAPLVPPFHAWCFQDPVTPRVLLNLGGIANVSLLAPGSTAALAGFDTGPGNCLMDDWTRHARGEPFDRDGDWAASGSVDPALLGDMLGDAYFGAAIPKSTGREYFNLEFIRRHLDGRPSLRSQDVQATLCALTVESIAIALDESEPAASLIVCGGGVHNRRLMTLLGERLPTRRVVSSEAFGVDPDYVEAAAFAWLAERRMSGLPVMLTTSREPRPLHLGAVYLPRP
ncbi:MAG: anhydro-N-acetylmuramic acid kinase [Gammaproteobacteria bacterium]|nr:anhydro-N-acetylmuramic acid kinase [Gammaproteobacteria bacterium]